MSKWESVTVTCPQCGCSQQVKAWQSLNVTLDPDEKKTLLDGEVNQFRCRACRLSAWLETAFVYHDMERQFIVEFLPPSLVRNPDLTKWFDENGAQRVPELLRGRLPEYMCRPHLVFSMEELVRYVQFRDRFPVMRRRNQE